MTRDQVKGILDRVLSWPADDQEKVARFVRELEERRADDDITDEEWKLSKRGPRDAISRATKRSNRSSVDIGVREAPI